ncbi:MAG: lytic murein transglycosylase B [Burkholderiales bacterium]
MLRRALVLLCALMWCASAHAADAAKPKAKSPKAASSAATSASSSASSSPTPAYGHRSDVRAFAAEVAAEAGISRTDVERWFAAARFQPKIVALMDRPLLEPPKWFEYAPPFLSQARIDGGVRFWRDNEEALARAEATYGVPPQIVVAIIGVETFYGRNTGGYRVIDALATLAFDYPRRAPFFKGELKEYVLLARDQGFSPLVPKGSFAGAMGVPQFMPGSYRRFAVDFDGDGHADLWRSNADVIGSIANYLARHDWQRGEPVLAPAAVAPEARDTALRRLDGGISERRPLAAWQLDGVTLRDTTQEAGSDPVGLLLLEETVQGGDAAQGKDTARGGDAGVGAASLWIAYPNFYVITRYNKSRLYAAAVWALSERLRASR